MPADDEVTALLSRVAERTAVPPPPPVAVFAARARRQRAAQRLAVTAGAIVVAAAVTTSAILSSRAQASRVTTRPETGTAPGPASSPPPQPIGRSGVFGAMTGDVLVFDDGYDGVAAVDLDDRTVSRRAIGGQEAGDQPWRLTLSGNDLIVGWDGVYADPVNGGSSRLLGNGTISVPAADPGDVWLVTYPAGRVGPGPLTVEEVTTDDRTVVPATTLTSPPGYPIVGVPGGIAFQSSAGLALWDAATQKVSQTLGSSQPQVGLSEDDHLVWCDGTCTSLHLTVLGQSDRVVTPPTGATAFQASSARFSPDGRYVAVVASGPGPADNSGGGTVVVVDTATGAMRTVTANVSWLSSVAWSPDGKRLYFASLANNAVEVTIGEFTLADGRMSTATVPAAVERAFVVVPVTNAAGLLAKNFGPAAACPPPPSGPTDRAGTCGYRF